MNTLVYFPSRGRGEVIRLALAEAGVEWKDETFKPDQLPALREGGRLPFHALPVWEEDGGFRLAQSIAILQHIGRAHGLVGKTPRELALVEQAIGATEDVRAEFRKISQADPAKRPEVRATLTSTSLPRWFGHLDKLLESNGGGDGFLVGDGVTTADLALYYLLELAHDNGFETTITPRLRAFANRIAARPKIAAYLASSRRFPLLKLPV